MPIPNFKKKPPTGSKKGLPDKITIKNFEKVTENSRASMVTDEENWSRSPISIILKHFWHYITSHAVIQPRTSEGHHSAKRLPLGIYNKRPISYLGGARPVKHEVGVNLRIASKNRGKSWLLRILWVPQAENMPKYHFFDKNDIRSIDWLYRQGLVEQ